MKNVLELAAPQCSAEEFDGEIVALNLDTGIYFSMKGAASRIFTDLCNGHPTDRVLAAAAQDAGFQHTADAFIQELVASGLLRPALLISEPKAELTLLTVALDAAQPPVLEAFGDIQSLLLLDPVHEVDEKMGWPNPSAA